MKKKKIYKNNEWQQIASHLSGENENKSETIASFLDKKGLEIKNYWKNMKNSRGKEKVNVDKAWQHLLNRLEKDKLIRSKKEVFFKPAYLLRIAAAVIILATLTFTGKYIISNHFLPSKSVVATSSFEKNRIIELSDGSFITLNRDSKVSFPDKFNSRRRKVKLTGEAFFEISPDFDRPFIIDAGNGKVTVLGTSFNVITDNGKNEVEVLVASGRVTVVSKDGVRSLTLEPGELGVINNNTSSSMVNTDINYLAWNTEILTYEGTRLEDVFSDLQRVYNISVEVDNNDILNRQLTSVFNNESAETIIRTICLSFNLKFEKKDGIYYLSNL
ncbi:MAG: FecR domain-containing protein [Bacteroidales bacterium]|nr:FecR domain-containing protein [Bacteroidales bacterium]